MHHRSELVGVAVLAAVLLACAVLARPVAAKEVAYPAGHPTVTMIVPDDWSVAETPLGLELQSPQKDALVLAAVVTGDKAALDDWSRRALTRMQQAGVSFAKTGPAVPAAAAARGEAIAVRPALPYTFNGDPSVDSPVAAAEKKALATVGARSGDEDLPTISTIDPRAATTGALRASGHYAYGGGKLNGQPVDVELAVFPLDKQSRLLVEQESGPTDARGVMIVRSVKAVPGARK